MIYSNIEHAVNDKNVVFYYSNYYAVNYVYKLCVHLTDCDVTGAQSDSEVVSSQPVEGGSGVGETTVSDRGYTSDSELYENLSRHGKNAGEMDVKPTKHGSWLLVSYNVFIQCSIESVG